MNRVVRLVAQIFNLLYRRVAFCGGRESKRLAAFAPRAAGCKPAIQQTANLRYPEAPFRRSTVPHLRLAPPIAHHASSITSALRIGQGCSTLNAQRSTAFTLLELLVVIGIIALIAAISLPTLNKFKPNYTASVTRQLLDALARGRQLAISQRTTVYMVFVPTNSWSDPAYNGPGFQQWISRYTNAVAYTNLLDKQFIGYNYVSLHTVGDQPGRPTVHYLSTWRTLPEGAFIYPGKFMQDYQWFNVYTNLTPPIAIRVYGFSHTNNIPFPSQDAPSGPKRDPYPMVPYIAFDYMGRLVSGNPSSPEIIPLAKGNVSFARGPDRKPVKAVPSWIEQPPGNATNATSYTLVYVDRLTGRARVVQPEVR